MHEENYLQHYGVLGMKWGVRRFQNSNGTLTNAGKKRYKDQSDESSNTQGKKKGLSDKQKKAIKVGAAVAGTALAAYGAYKVSKYVGTRIQKDSIARTNRLITELSMQGGLREAANVANSRYATGNLSRKDKLNYATQLMKNRKSNSAMSDYIYKEIIRR